jgi:hypothetical protein
MSYMLVYYSTSNVHRIRLVEPLTDLLVLKLFSRAYKVINFFRLISITLIKVITKT